MKILLESAGGGGKVGLIRCLREKKDLEILGADFDPASPCRSLFDKFFVMPAYSDPEYLNQLLFILKAERCHYLYPLATGSLNFFSQKIQFFAQHDVQTIISSHNGMQIANNKAFLYTFLKKHFPQNVPSFYLVENETSFLEAAKSLGFPEKKICARLEFSTGATGLRIITSDLTEIAHYYLHKNPTSVRVTMTTFLETLRACAPFPKLIVQEYLPGEEWDIDCLSHQRRCCFSFSKRNNIMLGGASLDCDVIDNPELNKLSRAIVDQIGLDYINQPTFMYDAAGIPKIIEINPRPPVSVDACLGLGVNLPLTMLDQIMGKPLPDFRNIQNYRFKYGRLFSGIIW